MREEQLIIGDIPTRIFTTNGASGLLLLGHGGGHSKDAERFVALSRFYAEHTGLSVVCIDAVDHGDRRPPAPTAGLAAGWHSRTADRMVTDWRAVVERLSGVGLPIAYVGFSMGAVFGFRRSRQYRPSRRRSSLPAESRAMTGLTTPASSPCSQVRPPDLVERTS